MTVLCSSHAVAGISRMYGRVMLRCMLVFAAVSLTTHLNHSGAKPRISVKNTRPN